MSFLVLAPPALLCVLGLAAFASRRHARVAEAIGSWAGAAVGAAGLAATIAALVLDADWSLSLPWLGKLGGSFTVGLDPVTGLFLLPVYGLTAVSSLYGGAYLRHGLHDAPAGRAGASWLAFHLLTASMVFVLLARNAVLFLAAWETMTLASWFLVTLEDTDEKSRTAGITYLVASQIGTVCLLAFFALLGAHAAPGGTAGALDFARFGGLAVGPAAAAFVLALVGFGTKAGLVPLHIWLPEAHPAAPSHVSAVMSGVMIKMGIYGLLRALLILGAPPAWWGWLMISVGARLRLARRAARQRAARPETPPRLQQRRERGIISLGLGLGMLGTSAGPPSWRSRFRRRAPARRQPRVLQGPALPRAGAVASATGTRDIELLGGLQKRMPVTGAAFLVGAAAIRGLPPLNGFVSEFLVLSGGIASPPRPGSVRLPCR